MARITNDEEFETALAAMEKETGPMPSSYHRANERIFLYAFDLIELNGDDLPRVACCWWARAGSWWASLPMPTPPVSEGRRAP